MANNELNDFLSNCAIPETGCFASDPKALSSMLYMDDGAVRSDFQRVAEASTDAGILGLPLEEVTYEPVKIEVVETLSRVDIFGEISRITEVKLGFDTPRRILAADAVDSDLERTRLRIARCAYACGTTAVGCPLRTAPEA